MDRLGAAQVSNPFWFDYPIVRIVESVVLILSAYSPYSGFGKWKGEARLAELFSVHSHVDLILADWAVEWWGRRDSARWR